MPNWAEGMVAVRGSSIIDIKNFLLRFLSDERKQLLKQSGNDDDYKYFARSFMDVYGRADSLNLFNSIEDCEDGTFYVEFSIQFAWSAACCLMDIKGSYLRDESNQRVKDLISLPEACIEHHVACEIYTEESGCCFEEHIVVNGKGEVLVDEAQDIEYYENEDGDTVVKPGGFAEDGCYLFTI